MKEPTYDVKFSVENLETGETYETTSSDGAIDHFILGQKYKLKIQAIAPIAKVHDGKGYTYTSALREARNEQAEKQNNI